MNLVNNKGEKYDKQRIRTDIDTEFDDLQGDGIG